MTTDQPGPVSELSGTILSVWAHPDDETYLAAGLMAAAVQAGQRVVCVTATRGELGSTDPDRWPPGEALAAVRTLEMERALAFFGVTEHHWLDYPDGGCADVDEGEAVARLAGTAGGRTSGARAHVRPGRADRPRRPHHRVPLGRARRGRPRRRVSPPRPARPPEHGVAGGVATRAGAPRRLHGLRTHRALLVQSWPYAVEFDGALLDAKVDALLAQVSQSGPMLGALGPREDPRGHPRGASSLAE